MSAFGGTAYKIEYLLNSKINKKPPERAVIEICLLADKIYFVVVVCFFFSLFKVFKQEVQMVILEPPNFLDCKFIFIVLFVETLE